ncbi:hypothetical protein ALC60_04085 [Trachymyrmex zeteki]|uniref:Uncharacterized protein n=1 Tax=Mycetomoellerius zeteki TaxID=64791 RepID=A0A151X9H7_9HYME|nr:hypothetical protein ALC60_04085 [Trachymyrmex zeteki]
MLKRRYDDKRLIIQKHVKALFDLPSISKENHTKLRQLLDGALKHSLTGDDIPTWHKLIEFLEHRCHILEAIDRKIQMQSSSTSQGKANQARSAAHLATNKALCEIYKGEHFIFSCSQFLKLAPEDRFKSTKENKLCLNCLRSSSHTAKMCKSSSCRTCSKRHNTLLHMNQSKHDVVETASSLQSKEQVKDVASSKVVSHNRSSYNITVTCLVLKQISERLPNTSLNKEDFKFPQRVQLADPTFYQSTDIEMLLGAETFWDILCVGRIKESVEHPLLQKTLFGWILGGKYPFNSKHVKSLVCNATTKSAIDLDEAIAKFWQIEQVYEQPIRSAEERDCEQHYERTHTRNNQGRFVVKLPIKQNEHALESLGSSHDTALKRSPLPQDIHTKWTYRSQSNYNPRITRAGNVPIAEIPANGLQNVDTQTIKTISNREVAYKNRISETTGNKPVTRNVPNRGAIKKVAAFNANRQPTEATARNTYPPRNSETARNNRLLAKKSVEEELTDWNIVDSENALNMMRKTVYTNTNAKNDHTLRYSDVVRIGTNNSEVIENKSNDVKLKTIPVTNKSAMRKETSDNLRRKAINNNINAQNASKRLRIEHNYSTKISEVNRPRVDLKKPTSYSEDFSPRVRSVAKGVETQIKTEQLPDARKSIQFKLELKKKLSAVQEKIDYLNDKKSKTLQVQNECDREKIAQKTRKNAKKKC